MALINGNDYDHIDFTKNGVTTRHMLKDTLSRQMSGDLVKVQNEEPTSEGTKIWIKPSGDSEVQVPTYEEFEELSEKIDDADATIESLAVGDHPTVSVTEVDGHKRFSFGIPASNGIASITKTATDGVIDTYTIAMTDGTSTSFSVNNSDITPESMVEAITTALQDYARIDGYYPDMTVGNAEQLNSSKFVENSEPYTLRTSGGTSDIGNREYLDAVVGGTLAWNQMVRDEASENSTDFADVVTVTDAVEDAAGVKVKIEPVQDLHGYDHPWPAGGGKNLFENTASTTTMNGVTFTVNDDGTVSASGTATADVRFDLGYWTATGETVIFNGCPNGGGTTTYRQFADYIGSNTGAGVSTTPTAGQKCNVRIQIYSGYTANNLLFKPMIRLASETDATFAPYSNICPITGWDGVKANRTGKNLFDNVWESGIISNTTGENIPGNTHVRCKNYIPCKNGQYIYVGWDTTATGSVYMLVMVYGVDGSFKRYAGARTVPFQLKLNDDEHFIRFYLYNRTEPLVNPYIVYGTTASDYEPYQGNTYTIEMPTEAGTVYGGELDVTTGVLTAKYALSVLDGDTTKYQLPANWYSNDMDAGRTSLGFYWYFTYRGMESWPFPQKYSNRIEQESHYKCDSLIANRFGIYGNDNHNTYWIQVNDNRGNSYVAVRIPISALEDTSTAALANQSAMDWLRANPVTIAYEIAEPQTYQLTPAQITTLLGENNVWADTGDLALTYTGTDEHLVLESGKKYLSRISGTDSMLLGSGQEITAVKGTDNVFDLTQMFGSAVADYVYGHGAGFFRRWFGKQWYPYNAGELMSVEGMQSHDMVGFNVWDEEWESGIISWSGGDTPSVEPKIRSKGYIPVLPNTTYTVTTTANLQLFYYDSEKVFLSYAPFSLANKLNFTTPANCCYVRFYTYYEYGTTYKNDICISLVHNGSHNGEYEPYEKHSYPLDSSVVLRGIPKVGANGVYWDGDRYLPDGTVTRKYGVVDLGTLTWAYEGGNITGSTLPIGQFRAATDSTLKTFKWHGNIIAPKKYINKEDGSWSNMSEGYIAVTNSQDLPQLRIVDSNYTDAESFKSAMSGFLIVYELATPTTETAQPYHSTQWVSDWGTEEFVSTGIVPVGHETRYPANLRDKLQHLPDAASGNGSYLITQTDGQMVLTPFPAPPSSAGNYVLKATVVNGVATYTWEVAT